MKSYEHQAKKAKEKCKPQIDSSPQGWRSGKYNWPKKYVVLSLSFGVID